VRVVVAPLRDFPPGERRIVTAGTRSIGVFRIGDRFYAVRNRCPHQGGPLCLGRIARWAASSGPGDFRMEGDACLIACPWHGWEYDLETGQSFLGPGEPRVKAYDVSVEHGNALEEPAPAESDPEPKGGRMPGPYVAETFPVYVEEEYVVLDA
jgi:nitrite reductase/ring-hydroxylating ferredoxin subunit